MMVKNHLVFGAEKTHFPEQAKKFAQILPFAEHFAETILLTCSLDCANVQQ